MPTLDHDLIARAERAATGATVHEVNALLGCYTNGHRRLARIKGDPKLADLEAGEVKFVEESERNLRAFLVRANRTAGI